MSWRDAAVSRARTRPRGIGQSRSRIARLRHAAAVEDVDYQANRGLDRALFLKLGTLDWIKNRRNLIITGPCGVGKSWLASALGQKACREDIAVRYHRIPRLFAALDLARGDGTYAKALRVIAKAKLLILDDWGPEPLGANQRRDLLEIIEVDPVGWTEKTGRLTCVLCARHSIFFECRYQNHT